MTRRALLLATAGSASLAADREEDPAHRIFRRVNELRAARNVPPLEWSKELTRCAQQQSERKALLRFPGHDDPERGAVSERLSAAGYRWSLCGENVFSMNGYEEIADFAIVFWWYSLGHQQNMVGPLYSQTGVGIDRGEDGTWFATQIFAAPQVPDRRQRSQK